MDEDEYEDDRYGGANFDDRNEQDMQRSDAKSDSETALEVLTALLSDHSEFASKYAAATFLHTAQSVDDKNFLYELEMMTNTLYRSLGEQNNTVVVHADDIDQLHSALEPYTNNQPRSGIFSSSSTDETPMRNLWPLVLKIHVAFSNPVTDAGIELADVPGITDVNQQRRKTAINALRECTHYIVTGKISRITSDSQVKAYLEQTTATTSQNTLLVATNSDVTKRSPFQYHC